MYSYRSNAPKTHDRKAKDVGRGLAGHIVPCEVDDPFALEPGAKIVTLRSIRGDPLADRHSRHHISDVQYQAGRLFQRLFERAQRGLAPMPLTERVDNSAPNLEGLADDQLKAQASLSRAYKALGQSGTILAKTMLIDGLTAKQVASSRGLQGKLMESFFAKRFEEVLDTLAQVFGLVATAR
jgi:hypothetical protein